MLSHRQQGVTLLELMVGISLTGLLLAIAVPNYASWIRNTQNRAAAESILNGLQLARNEAVRRNTVVRFSLTNSTGLVEWTVGCAVATTTCPANIQSRTSNEGSEKARVGVSTTAIATPVPATQFDTALGVGDGLLSGVSFNGLGRVTAAPAAATNFTRADIVHATENSARRYVVVVGLGGQARMCDPSVAFSTNPQGCS